MNSAATGLPSKYGPIYLFIFYYSPIPGSFIVSLLKRELTSYRGRPFTFQLGTGLRVAVASSDHFLVDPSPASFMAFSYLSVGRPSFSYRERFLAYRRFILEALNGEVDEETSASRFLLLYRLNLSEPFRFRLDRYEMSSYILEILRIRLHFNSISRKKSDRSNGTGPPRPHQHRSDRNNSIELNVYFFIFLSCIFFLFSDFQVGAVAGQGIRAI